MKAIRQICFAVAVIGMMFVVAIAVLGMNNYWNKEEEQTVPLKTEIEKMMPSFGFKSVPEEDFKAELAQAKGNITINNSRSAFAFLAAYPEEDILIHKTLLTVPPQHVYWLSIDNNESLVAFYEEPYDPAPLFLENVGAIKFISTSADEITVQLIYYNLKPIFLAFVLLFIVMIAFCIRSFLPVPTESRPTYPSE